MDPVALASVISSAAVGLAGVGVAGWSVYRTAKTARESRIEQRAADAYLEVLQLVQREADWLKIEVDRREFDREDPYWSPRSAVGGGVPKPTEADRTMTAALLGTFGSSTVQSLHASWRVAADEVLGLVSSIMFDRESPFETVSAEEIRRFREDLQPKEGTARKALADAIAAELGHRRATRRPLPQ